MAIDLAYTNYGLPDDVWQKLQEHNDRHLLEHPVCEICNKNSSVRITPIGTLRAACLECIDNMRAEVQRDIDESLKEYYREEEEYRRNIMDSDQYRAGW